MSIEAKHFADLNRRAQNGGYAVFSDFLGLAEMSELLSMRLNPAPQLWGGFENAERVVAGFGECENNDFPISVIEIRPLNQKFADKLTHRDFLGSLIGLGIKRDVLGDIIINDNTGYLFCLKSIAPYISDNMRDVKRTRVSAEILDELPCLFSAEPEIQEYIVSSLRLDVLAAAVFNLSRKTAAELFSKEKVFVGGVLKHASYTAAENDKITVRGYGKFTFIGEKRRTKKDRLVVQIEVYK